METCRVVDRVVGGVFLQWGLVLVVWWISFVFLIVLVDRLPLPPTSAATRHHPVRRPPASVQVVRT